MAFPGIDEIRQTFQQLPSLEASDLDAALSASGKGLQEGNRLAFLAALNSAFGRYLRDRLWQLWAVKMSASEAANRLARIANATDKLVGLLGLAKGADSMPKSLLRVLMRESELHGERIDGYPGLPAVDFAMTGKWHQGEVKLRECLDDLVLLQEFLHAALAHERTKITPQTARSRREGDEAMPGLFDKLNQIWAEAFGEIPGASWSAYKGEATGPYVSFLVALFKALREKLPGETVTAYPKLARGIELNANAVRSRFRRAVVPDPTAPSRTKTT